MDPVGSDLKAIFTEALQRSPGPSRRAYLDEACGTDADLRRRVETLLAAHERADALLGPSDPPATTIGDRATGAIEATNLHQTVDHASSPVDAATTVPGGNGDGLARGSVVRYFGDYEILRELGRGGMGVVYEARQVSLNRPVALKMVRAGHLAGDDELRRFRNEAEAVALLDHPGIVPVYEVGEHDGQHFFSMKLVPGGSLVPVLDRYRNDPIAAATLVAEAAEAVAHAHARGILHRDLKPANLLVDEHGHPHVTDFGLAKKVEGDAEFTQSGAILGTPAYMSPEQATGRRGSITTATDVYGLGALLYALLTGQGPFGGDSVVETIDAVRNLPPQPPRKVNSTVPRDLETICLKCLEKDPHRRYPTAQALADDLHAWLESRPIAARRVGTLERARLWCKRRPAVAALSALVALALVGGTWAVVAVQARANAELTRANKSLRQQRQIAGRREQQAIQGVSRFCDAITRNPRLKNDPTLRDLRKTLLTEPLRFFHSLRENLQADRDSSPEALSSLAYSLASVTKGLGDLNREIGDMKDALAAYEEARVLLRGLVDSNPSADNLGLTGASERLTEVLTDIASTYVQAGRWDEAIPFLEEARDVAKKRVADHPHDYLPLRQLARTLENLGLFRSDFGKPAETLALYREAAESRERMIQVNPGMVNDPGFRHELALKLRNVGILQVEMGKPAEALASFEKARENLQKFRETIPGNASLQPILAEMHYNTAWAQSQMGRTAETLSSLRAAREIRQRLLEANPAVSLHRRRLAGCQHEIGNQLSELGRTSEADTTFRQALVLMRELPAGDHAEPAVRAELAGILVDLAAFQQRTGRAAEAEAGFREGFQIFRDLVETNARVPSYRMNLAASHEGLASLLSEAGRPAEAEDEFRAALAIWRGVADSDAGKPADRERVARVLIELGLLLTHTGRPSDAETVYREAREIMRELVGSCPDVLPFRAFLAKCQVHLGSLLTEQGRLAEAEAELLAARALFEKLTADASEKIWCREGLAKTLTALGDVACRVARPAEARGDYDRAVDLLEAMARDVPADQPTRRLLASSLRRRALLRRDQGDAAGSAADARRAVSLWQDSVPTGWFGFEIACAHATLAGLAGRSGSGVPASESPGEAIAALSALREAAELGYRNVDQYRTDPALDPIRDRADFKRLMIDLAMPAEPFAPAP
jgi:tetratricopeptide (TPR) repeat protein